MRRLGMALLVVVALVASATPARAAEPGWQPLHDLGFGFPAMRVSAYPLPDGRFLVLAVRSDTDGNGFQALVYEVGGATRQVAGPIDLQSPDDIDLATSPSGAARLVWRRFTPGYSEELVTAAKAPGGEFGSPVVLSQDSGDAPRVAMNAAGEAAITRSTWDTGLEVIFVDAAGNAGAPVLVRGREYSDTSNINAGGGDVVLSDAGEAVVVFNESQSTRTCNPDYSCDDWKSVGMIRAAHGDAAGFSAPVTLADVNRTSAWYSLAGDANGGAIVGWWADDRGGVALRQPGGEFGPSVQLPVVGWGYAPAVAVARDGSLIAAYSYFDEDSRTMHVLFHLGNTSTGVFGGPIATPSERPLGGWPPHVGASWSGERVMEWGDASGLSARWIGADGSIGPQRQIICGYSTTSLADPAISAGRGFAAALNDWAYNDPAYQHAFGSFAEPGPTGVDCGPPPSGAGPGPYGPGVTPAPETYLFDYYHSYDNKRRRATALLSPPAPDHSARLPAAWSNAASDHATFSQDNRNARLVAYDSLASNLVRGDTNHQRDVFVFRRAHGGGNLYGDLLLASEGTRGAPANGPSSRPSLDGETHAAPHCVAFESQATNLARGDRSSDPDVYLRDLRRGRTVLLSPGLHDAHDAVVDGRCATVTFEARGSVWVTPVRSGRPSRVARGSDPDQQTNGEGVAYVRGGQVWYRPFRLLSRRHRVVVAPGRERLVSATAGGRPGNGASANPSLDDSGAYVAFESAATDLCAGACTGASVDRNGPAVDIFRRTLSRHAPTKDRMQMVNYSFSNRAQYGSGSFNPVISGAGENVVFEERDDSPDPLAPPSLPGEQRRILRSWSFPRARGTGELRQIARQCAIFLCRRAPVMRPAMSSRGNYLAFTSVGTEFCDSYVKLRGGRPRCPTFTDVYLQYVGPSHEGYPLG